MKSDTKRTCFLALVVLVLISLACSANNSNGTWQVSTSFSPQVSSAKVSSSLVNAICDEYLTAELLFQAQMDNGIYVCCDIENNWIAFDSSGFLICNPPAPDTVPNLIEPSDNSLYIQTNSQEYFLTYSNDGVWFLDKVLK